MERPKLLPEHIELDEAQHARLDKFVRLELDKIAESCAERTSPVPLCAMAFDTYADDESAPVLAEMRWLPVDVRNAPFLNEDVDGGSRQVWSPGDWPIDWSAGGDFDRHAQLGLEIKAELFDTGCREPDRMIFNAFAHAAVRRDWTGTVPTTADFLCLAGLGVDDETVENLFATLPPDLLVRYWKRGWLRWPTEWQQRAEMTGVRNARAPSGVRTPA